MKNGSNNNKVGFQLWIANLIIASIGVRQAYISGCAYLKLRWCGGEGQKPQKRMKHSNKYQIPV